MWNVPAEPLNSAQAEEEEAGGRRNLGLPNLSPPLKRTSQSVDILIVPLLPSKSLLPALTGSLGRERGRWVSDCPFWEESFGVSASVEGIKHKALTFHEEVEVTAHFGRLRRVKPTRSRPSAGDAGEGLVHQGTRD